MFATLNVSQLLLVQEYFAALEISKSFSLLGISSHAAGVPRLRAKDSMLYNPSCMLMECAAGTVVVGCTIRRYICRDRFGPRALGSILIPERFATLFISINIPHVAYAPVFALPLFNV